MNDEEIRDYLERHTLIGASARLNRECRELGMIVLRNLQSYWWRLQHLAIVHLFGLGFCHSCSGYFHKACMPLPDKCAECFARDNGV